MPFHQKKNRIDSNLILLICFCGFFHFSVFLRAEVTVKDSPGPKVNTVNLLVRLIEADHAVADSFEDRLNMARTKGDIADARGAVELLNGIVREGEAATEKGRIIFRNIKMGHGYHGVDGEMLTYSDAIEPDGFLADVSISPIRGDRAVNVWFNVKYGEESLDGGIERSSTSAQGKSRLYSGWPNLIFRWDQFAYSRMMIVSMQAPPISHGNKLHGVEARSSIKIYRDPNSDNRRRRRRNDGELPPFRTTSNGDLMSQFTSVSYNGLAKQFSDGYFVSSKPRKNLGVFMMDRSIGIETWYPWMSGLSNRRSLMFPKRYDLFGFTAWRGSSSFVSKIRGSVSFSEAQGRHVTPPFSRGRYPKEDEFVNHSVNFEGPLPYLEEDLSATKNSSTHYQLKIHSRVLNAVNPDHLPLK